MPDPTTAEYCRFADSRLTEARDKFQRAVVLGYAGNIVEVAKVASLIWDAAIDLISALASLNGRRGCYRQYPRMCVSTPKTNMKSFPSIARRYWRHLARLHNFQHKPNLLENEFRLELYYTGMMLDYFNNQLPPPMQLAAYSLIWLTAAANQPNP